MQGDPTEIDIAKLRDKVYAPQIELMSLLGIRGSELCQLSGRMFEAQFNANPHDIYTRIVREVEERCAEIAAAVARFKDRTADRSPSPTEGDADGK